VETRKFRRRGRRRMRGWEKQGKSSTLTSSRHYCERRRSRTEE
jgi:hypothetical protein